MQPRAEGLIPKKTPVDEPRSVVSVAVRMLLRLWYTWGEWHSPLPRDRWNKEAGGHVNLPLLVLAHVRRMPFAPTLPTNGESRKRTGA